MQEHGRFVACIVAAAALHVLLFLAADEAPLPEYRMQQGKSSMAVRFSPPASSSRPTVNRKKPVATTPAPKGPGEHSQVEKVENQKQPPVPEDAEPTPASRSSPPSPASRRQTAAKERRDRPSAVVNPAPPYPADALRWGVQGTVVARMKVLPDGTVERVWIKESSGYMSLDDAAVTTLSTWRFDPVGDRTKPRWLEQKIRFELDSGESRLASREVNAAD